MATLRRIPIAYSRSGIFMKAITASTIFLIFSLSLEAQAEPEQPVNNFDTTAFLKNLVELVKASIVTGNLLLVAFGFMLFCFSVYMWREAPKRNLPMTYPVAGMCIGLAILAPQACSDFSSNTFLNDQTQMYESLNQEPNNGSNNGISMNGE